MFTFHIRPGANKILPMQAAFKSKTKLYKTLKGVARNFFCGATKIGLHKASNLRLKLLHADCL